MIQTDKALVVMELVSLRRGEDTEYKQVHTTCQEVITRVEIGDREFRAGGGMGGQVRPF